MPGLPSKPNNIPLASSLPRVSFRRIPAEEALALAAPAGVLDQQNVDFGFSDGRPFERPEHYLRYIEPIESELKQRVEYDMDEQDQEWLDALNADRKREQLDVISNETFEIIVDQLEKEWFDLMKQVPLKPPHGAAEDGDDGDEDGEDTKCAICDDGEGENSNAIVFCDGCNLAVHQDCYGIPYVPEGQWLCRKCTVSPDRAVSCLLCPHEGGAFKQTTQGKWAHLLCAMWIPETGVSNPVYMEPIDSVEKIPKARWKLQCYLCRCKMGACIQCDSKVCYAAFHVTCAMRAGLLIQTERKRADHHGNGSDDDSGHDAAAPILRARCHKHIPPKLRDQLKISFDRANAMMSADDELDAATRGSPLVTSRTREQSTDSGPGPYGQGAALIPVSRSGSVQADQNGATNKSARAYKKSYRAGPPLVPAYIINRVLEYITKIPLRKKPLLVPQIARFWSLKREARRGAPLLKRLHLEPWTASSHSKEQTDAQKVKKLAFLNTLRNDLEAVRMLAELVRKREREKLRQARLLRDVLVNATLFPYYETLTSTLAKIEALDRTHIFAAPVSRTEVPDYYDVIKEPMDWSTIKEKLHEKAYGSVQEFKDDVGRVLRNAMIYNKTDTLFHKAAARIQKLLPSIFRDLEAIEDLHLASFKVACRSLRAAQGGTAVQDTRSGAEAEPELGGDVRDTLQQLRLEPPLEHIRLLRDYEAMAPKELNDVRGPEDKLVQFFSGVLDAAVQQQEGGSASTQQRQQQQPPPLLPPTQVANIVEDLSRQFYRPRIPAAQFRKVMGRNASASQAGATTLNNTRSRRQSFEASNDSPAAGGDRRISRRLKGEATDEAPLKAPQATPRPGKKLRSTRAGTSKPATPAVVEATVAGLSVPPIAEDGEAEQLAEQSEGEPRSDIKIDADGQGTATMAMPKPARSRAVRAAIQRSSRSTRSRPTVVDEAHDPPSINVESKGSTEGEGAAGAKPKRQKRGQIPGEPEEIVTEEVDNHDSFLRFNTGWILKEGAKRNRGGRAPPTTEEPPSKRPRKASAPSANTSQFDASSIASPQQRPRSKTQPTKPDGQGSSRLARTSGPSDASMSQTMACKGTTTPSRSRQRAPSKTDATTSLEEPVEPIEPADSVEPVGPAEAAANKLATSYGQPSTTETHSRSTVSKSEHSYGGNGRATRARHGRASTAEGHGSSPLSAEGEGGGEAAEADADRVGREEVSSAGKAARRGTRSTRKAAEASGGASPDPTAATETATATATATAASRGATASESETVAAAATDDIDDTDGENGISADRAKESRKSKVKIPSSASQQTPSRKSPRKPNRNGKEVVIADVDADAAAAEDALCIPHTLVWAKMEGFPFFPAEVVDETDDDEEISQRVLDEKARQEIIFFGGGIGSSEGTTMRRQTSTASSTSSQPNGSVDVDGGAEQETIKEEQERKLVLVLFWSATVREYVWLPKSKLKMMFEDETLDAELLTVKQKKYAKHRRKVKEAYELAKAQLEA